jgi:CRP/FNR family transcriptional regulator
MESLKISNQEDDVFKLLAPETLLKLDRIKEVKNYKKGDYIFNEGHKQTGIYYIYSGCVKILKNNKDGSSRIIYISRSGDLIGWERLIENSYSKDAIALVDSKIYCFPTSSFQEILKEDPTFSLELIRYLCKGKLRLESNFFQNSLKQKLAANILQLIERFGTAYNNYIKIELPLTKMDIAALIGTNPETLVKLLSEFKRNRILEFEDKNMLVLDITVLHKLSNM